MAIDRRDLLKLLGALGLGALGGVLATDIMHGLGERIIVQAALPGVFCYGAGANRPWW